MTFLQPYLLWALPLVTVPLLIHFLNRMRYRTVPWAAMMFLLAATRQSVRHAKRREILLLACRVAAVLFLVLFLARPLIGGWLGWAFHSAPDTIVLLLDRSPSMELNGKRALAIRQIIEAGRALEGRSRFVLLDSTTRKSTQLASLALLDELPAAQPSDASANIPALLQSAADYAAATQSGRTELWIASDLQSTDWQPENATRWAEIAARLGALPQDIRVRLLALREPATAENASVAVVDARRRKTGAKTELALTIDLVRTGATPVEIPVTVVVEGARSVVNVKMDGSQLRMQHKLDLGTRTTRGWGWVELPADANGLDNVSYFVFDGERHLETVVAATDAGVGRVLGLAAAPAPDVLDQSSRLISPVDFSPRETKDAALLIYQGTDTSRARTFAEAGGTVLTFPVTGEETKLPVTRWRNNDGPLATSDEGEDLPVREISVTRRSNLPGNATVLAAFDDAQPFLTRERIGKGSLYACATLPDRHWSTLAEGTVLVPMVQRLLREGSRRLGAVTFQTCGNDPLADARRLDKETGGDGVAGIYQRGAVWVAFNRPGSEDVREFADVDATRKLFGNVPVRVFEEKDSSGKLAGETWRVFVWLMLFALIGEAALTLVPRSKRTEETAV